MKKKLIIMILFLFVFLTGCSEKEQIKNEQNSKLSNAELIANTIVDKGYKEISDSEYELKAYDDLDENGKPVHVDYYYIDVDKLTIRRMVRFKSLSLVDVTYDYKSDIASGTYILLDLNDDWESVAKFTYNFKSGQMIIDDENFNSSCTNFSIELKNEISDIINKSGVSV